MDEFNQPLDSGITGQDPNGLRFTSRLSDTLLGTAKWTNFISIVLMVFLALAAVAMLGFGSMMGAMMGGMGGNMGGGAAMGGAAMMVFFIVYLGILGYLVWLLYTAGRDIRRGINTNDQATLEAGMTSMRRYWKMCGILLAIVLGFYVLFFIFMVGLGSMGMMGH